MGNLGGGGGGGVGAVQGLWLVSFYRVYRDDGVYRPYRTVAL